MVYKHFYCAVFFRISLLILLAGLTTWLFFVKQNIPLGIVAALLLLVVAILLVRYFNRMNRWISYFLMGIENEDTSLKIPSSSGNRAIDNVYRGMQRLNELFRQTKTEIVTQEQYFRSVISQSSTGLFSVNEKGRVIHINPEAEKLVGLHEYHHMNILKNIDKALPEFILQYTRNSRPSSAIFENRYGQKLLFKLSEITIKNEKIKLIAVSDITKELDNREVDAWIKLSRTLSHEMMNNIAPITTLSNVILGYYSKNNRTIAVEEVTPAMIARTVKGLKVIEERSRGLMNFVDNYRKFTKLPEPRFAIVNLSELIERNLLAAGACPGFDAVRIRKSVPDDILFPTDAELLSQVLTNLLKNAVEALNAGKTGQPVLEIKLWQPADDGPVKIEIANNGPEIPPEIREQIFVPFFTTKENGSGIGLSLSKQIMLSLGGDILLNTKKKGQTSFILVLNKTR
ncbi:PAS domain S-box protein [Candidatus Sulfidibacterium hydrothermale]|uniref:sensor histidine kinase n=1 Tax=Candidatus Sulfidibacterium hydrothermale TaxID=2875962 RepID=UPI001F0A0645|nr:ATP-binding protein [Candidatus Sulfidibacterium hydrothermale]UBM63161.1 PAS domain S-box protein [Candidatus Sulfidibacterium hydrothermale]